MSSGATPAPPSGWQGSGPPESRAGAAFAYDARDGYTVMFGGYSGCCWSSVTNDTWIFAGGNWTSLRPYTAPSPRAYASLAYDSIDDYLLLFGGVAIDGTVFNDTWAFWGSQWRALAPTIAPSAREAAAMVEDPSAKGVMLVGGGGANGSTNDTWKFSGGNWSSVPTSGSLPDLAGASAFFDTASNQVLLFGGVETMPSGPQILSNSTWALSGPAWSNVTVGTAPSARAFAGAAFDPVAGLGYLFGGQTVFGTGYNDTWVFSAGTWSQLPVITTPPARGSQGITFDAGLGGIIMAGGQSSCMCFDWWAFANSTWTNLTSKTPPPRGGAGSTYDPFASAMILFGGYTGGLGGGTLLNDTWTYHSGDWTQLHPGISPSARFNPSMTYDAADGYVLLFGGSSQSCLPLGICSDTWEFVAGDWHLITPPSNPAARSGAGMTFDATSGVVVLFGGSTVSGSPAVTSELNDTWAYSGGFWSDLTSNDSAPPADGLPALTFDSSAGAVVLLDPVSARTLWLFESGAWKSQPIGTAAYPGPRSGALLVDDPADGGLLLFGGQDSPRGYQSPLGDTWTLHGSNWSLATSAQSPGPRSEAAGTFDSAAGVVVVFGGLPSSGEFLGDQWTWGPGRGWGPHVASIDIQPAATDIGVSVSIGVDATGGSAPLAFSYGGMPSGCSSVNSSTLSCTPLVSGVFEITVMVSDVTGNFAEDAAFLQVNSRPSVVSFYVSPSKVALGSALFVSTTISGGTYPIAYSYVGLPPGCSTQSVPAFTCFPGTAGSFTIAVKAIDAVGSISGSRSNVSVAPAGQPGHPLISAFYAQPSTIGLGNSTRITLNASSGSGYLSYAFAGLPSGCATANVTVLNCTPSTAGRYNVSGAATDAIGNSTLVSLTLQIRPAGGPPGASIFAFEAEPSLIRVSELTILTVNATGGIGTLAYSYAGLPPGCSSAASAVATCRPTSSGTFILGVRVTDALGRTSSASTVLQVTSLPPPPAPEIAAFAADPSVVVVDSRTILTAIVTGGFGWLNVTYSGLPGGCVTQNTTTLTCTPTEVGDFTVHLTVNDSLGRTAVGSLSLRVQGSPPGPQGASPPSDLGTVLGQLAPLALYLTAVGGVAAALGAWSVLRRRADRRSGEAMLRSMVDAETTDAPESGELRG